MFLERKKRNNQILKTNINITNFFSKTIKKKYDIGEIIHFNFDKNGDYANNYIESKNLY